MNATNPQNGATQAQTPVFASFARLLSQTAKNVLMAQLVQHAQMVFMGLPVPRVPLLLVIVQHAHKMEVHAVLVVVDSI